MLVRSGRWVCFWSPWGRLESGPGRLWLWNRWPGCLLLNRQNSNSVRSVYKCAIHTPFFLPEIEHTMDSLGIQKYHAHLFIEHVFGLYYRLLRLNSILLSCNYWQTLRLIQISRYYSDFHRMRQDFVLRPNAKWPWKLINHHLTLGYSWNVLAMTMDRV